MSPSSPAVPANDRTAFSPIVAVDTVVGVADCGRTRVVRDRRQQERERAGLLIARVDRDVYVPVTGNVNTSWNAARWTATSTSRTVPVGSRTATRRHGMTCSPERSSVSF